MKVYGSIEYYIDLEILVFTTFNCLDSGSFEVALDILLDSPGLSFLRLLGKGSQTWSP